MFFRNWSLIFKKKRMDEKIYPSMVLGLDISTACIGISIVYDDGEHEPKIVKMTHVVPKIPSKIKGIEALILRKEIFEKEFLSQIKDSGITECIIESPLMYATGNSNANTVFQLAQFNALLSEAVYRVLGIVPNYLSSYDARMYSFPELIAIRKFNKKGELYPYKHFVKSAAENHAVLFGAYPFDCDKKNIMMNLVCEKYPDINWTYDAKGNLKKENYDACDSLVCSLAYINKKRYGELNPTVTLSGASSTTDGPIEIEYTLHVWDKDYPKKVILS